MWASEAQIIWEEAAKKIGIKIKTDWSVNLFIDYWELHWDSKVEDLEEEVPLNFKLNFYKRWPKNKKRRSHKKRWTHKKKSKYARK